MRERRQAELPRETLLGYGVEARGLDGCLADIVSWVRSGDGCRWLACLNPHSYATARSDPTFASALRGAAWLAPDGVGIVLASRLLGGRLRSRITGTDVFLGVMRRLNDSGGARAFYLGSTEEALARIRERVAVDFPNITVVGTHSPPFRVEHSEAEVASMVDAVNAAAPDLLWVGMTAPKQEKWLHANAHRLRVPFAAGIGAVFDFYTGRVRRSHPLFQRMGLEWLPRLLREPRRLWRRMFVSAPVFLADVARERIRKRH